MNDKLPWTLQQKIILIIGIIVFIGGILMILFGSPEEVGYKANAFASEEILSGQGKAEYPNIVGAIVGGFTILGVLLTLGAWINGRSIKKLIREEFRAARELINRMDERTEQRHQEVVELLKKGFSK